MTVTVTLPDGNALELADGATGADAAAAIGPGLARAALAIEVGGADSSGDSEVCDLARGLPDGARVAILTSRSGEKALELIRHDAAHVLATAVMELYEGVKISIGPPIEDGFYYDFEFPDTAAVSDADLPRIEESWTIDRTAVAELPDRLRSAQRVFDETGGLHAAGLFARDGSLEASAEDVGRHNAVDKVIGWALMADRVPLRDSVLLVSGRGGFEIVQKAIVAGLPVVASVSAPSSLAVQLAREMRQTLIGFLRGRRFLIYAGEERIESS